MSKLIFSRSFAVLATALLLIFSSCGQEEIITPNTTGEVALSLEQLEANSTTDESVTLSVTNEIESRNLIKPATVGTLNNGSYNQTASGYQGVPGAYFTQVVCYRFPDGLTYVYGKRFNQSFYLGKTTFPAEAEAIAVSAYGIRHLAYAYPF